MERNPNSKTLWGWGVGKNTKKRGCSFYDYSSDRRNFGGKN